MAIQDIVFTFLFIFFAVGTFVYAVRFIVAHIMYVRDKRVGENTVSTPTIDSYALQAVLEKELEVLSFEILRLEEELDELTGERDTEQQKQYTTIAAELTDNRARRRHLLKQIRRLKLNGLD